MMIFSELYSIYYQTVAAILKTAVDHPLAPKEMQQIIENYAFGESTLHILPALQEQQWQLIAPDGTTPIQNEPSMPLTILEKRWLNAIAKDKRMHLFCDEVVAFPDVEPLFFPEDILVFDRYADGDPYEDATYIQNFRLVLDAIKQQYPLKITLKNRREKLVSITMMPKCLEYSEKDDKFRLIGATKHFDRTINLGRMIDCKRSQNAFEKIATGKNKERKRKVVFELIDQRNALERVLLHFAHCEKQAEKLDKKQYRITVVYDKEDETEMLIRILSFGPMIKVTAPEHFVDMIKQRLLSQKSCEL